MAKTLITFDSLPRVQQHRHVHGDSVRHAVPPSQWELAKIKLYKILTFRQIH
jgi:hypothetical protein